MEAEVWERLPEEILPQILTRLPWWSNLHLRAVSRSWKAMLSNHDFLARSLPLACPRPPCCILSTIDECAIVNFAIRKWHVSSQFSLLSNFREWDGFEISAATGGLFLMEGQHESLGRYLVNPLNKTHKKLPPVPQLDDQSESRGIILHHPMTMVVDDNTRNVRVVAVQFRVQTQMFDVPGQPRVLHLILSDTELWRIYVYDKSRDTWDLISRDLPSERLQTIECAILVGDDLYLLAKQQGYSHRHRILKALLTTLVEIPVDFTCGLPTVHIFQHRGFLMLVSGTGNDILPPSVDIWKFDHGNETWQKVVSMPEDLVEAFYKGLHNGVFNFDAEGDFVCFANHFHSEIIIVHNLILNLWWSISCMDYINQDLDFHDTFLWQPRLDIVL